MAVLLVVCACGEDVGTGPHIDMLAPPSAAAGATLEVLGVNFCGADMMVADDTRCPQSINGFVSIGTAPGILRATVVDWRSTRITVTVPSVDPGVTSVVVTVDGVQSNAVDFTVAP